MSTEKFRGFFDPPNILAPLPYIWEQQCTAQPSTDDVFPDRLEQAEPSMAAPLVALTSHAPRCALHRLPVDDLERLYRLSPPSREAALWLHGPS